MQCNAVLFKAYMLSDVLQVMGRYINNCGKNISNDLNHIYHTSLSLHMVWTNGHHVHTQALLVQHSSLELIYTLAISSCSHPPCGKTTTLVHRFLHILPSGAFMGRPGSCKNLLCVHQVHKWLIKSNLSAAPGKNQDAGAKMSVSSSLGKPGACEALKVNSVPANLNTRWWTTRVAPGMGRIYLAYSWHIFKTFHTDMAKTV